MLSDKPFTCPIELLSQSSTATVMAVVGATDSLTLKSAQLATNMKLIEPVLIGDEPLIKQIGEEIEWDLSSTKVVSARNEQQSAEIATLLARDGEVEALMKGNVHTDILMRAVLNRHANLRTDNRLSHAFHMTIPNRPGSLVITDAAINVAPSVNQRLEILHNVVAMMHALGNLKPKIAVLSATETPNQNMPSSVEAEQIVTKARKEMSGLEIAGPLAFDNALSTKAARIKGIKSTVAGAAEVLLVPNIETGNVLFKAMVYLLSATAAGIVLGAKIPIVLTSRADPPEARLASTALANIVAKKLLK